MKAFLLIITIIFSLNSFALDESVFTGKYPSLKDYQDVCLQGLNTYFFTFLSKSIYFKDDSGNIVLKFQNDSGATVLELNARIERKMTGGELTESVQYILPNANIFSYSIKKTGNDTNPTPDADLLTLNFKKLQSNYEININQLQTKLQKNGMKDFLIFGFMEVNVMIHTLYLENEAVRNYIYFFKGMPNPQSSLTVKAIETPDSPLLFNYYHSSQGAEIAPKYFFQGLQEGASIFKDFSTASLQIIKGIGFPAIKGIN
jgi:hypothetical protein